MCEILIIAQRADPKEDVRTAFLPGDLVAVQEDGAPWGRLECPPTFEVVSLAGVSADRVRPLLVPWLNANGTSYRASLWRWASGFLERKSDKFRFEP